MTATGDGDPLHPSEEAKYFQVIEERFCALRGAAMLLSPRDWRLIGGWWAERIPLFLVLESLEEVFLARKARADAAATVNSLAYVKPEVLRRWTLHREMHAARRGEREESERLQQHLLRHLGRMARRLKDCSAAARDKGLEDLGRTLVVAASEVRRLRKDAVSGGWNLPGAESILEKLDSEVLQASLSSLDETTRQRIDERAREILLPHASGMRREALQESSRALQGRLVRRELGLPHLSLVGED